jgi:hypothetical protein
MVRSGLLKVRFQAAFFKFIFYSFAIRLDRPPLSLSLQSTNNPEITANSPAPELLSPVSTVCISHLSSQTHKQY